MIKQKGFSLLEAIISVAVITIIIGGTVFLTSAEGIDPTVTKDRLTAINMAQEGLDAVYSIRNQRWRNLERTTSTHGLEFNGSNLWIFDGTEDVEGKFTRTITIEDVSRNGSNAIDETGTYDAQSKKVTVAVTWVDARGENRSYDIEAYLNNWNSLRLIEDTNAEFQDGTNSNTNTDNSVVTLDPITPVADLPIYTNGFNTGWSGSISGGSDVDEAYDASTYSSPSSILLDLSSNGSYDIQRGTSVDATNYDNLQFRMNVISPFSFGLYTDSNLNSYDQSTVTINNTVYGNATFPHNTNTDALITVWPSIDTGPYSSDSNVDVLVTTGNYTFSGSAWNTYQNRVVLILAPSNRSVTVDFSGAQPTRNISIITTGRMIVKNYNNNTLSGIAGYPVLASTSWMRFDTDANLTLNGVVYSDDYFDSQALNGSNRISLNGSLVVDRLNATRLERVNIIYNSAYDSPEPKYFTYKYAETDFTITPIGPGSYTSVDLSTYYTGDAKQDNFGLVDIPLADMNADTETALDGFTIEDTSGNDVATLVLDNILLSGAVLGDPYVTSGIYISHEQDGGSSGNLVNYLTWTESNVGGAYDVEFQLRTAATQAGLSTANWCATDCSGTTWLTDPTGQETLDPSLLDGTDDRWMQYRIQFTGDGQDTAEVSEVKLNYSG